MLTWWEGEVALGGQRFPRGKERVGFSLKVSARLIKPWRSYQSVILCYCQHPYPPMLHYCDPHQHVDRYLLNCCCPLCTCQNVDEEWTAATMLLIPLMCKYTCDAICVKFWNCYISTTTVMHTLLHCIYLKYSSLFLWMQFYFWSGI